MKNSFIKRTSIILLSLTILPASLFAHPGRTDSRGGHKDNKNKSGLGSYHYHCGGNPAHLHTNGCPYKGGSTSSPTPSGSSSQSSSQPLASKTTKPKYQSTVAKFNINGVYIELDGVIDNEMTLVEMRPLCDALGITIDWNNATSTANCAYGNTTFSLTIGTKSAKLNGQPYALERSPKVVDGSTMIPARFVAEAIGKSVIYNSSTGLIEIKDITNKGTATDNGISSSEMRKIGVKFVTIDNQNVASLWNTAIYYNVGSDIIKTKYMLGEKNTVKLSDKVKIIDGKTTFPIDVMNYLYIEPENVNTALSVFGITDYEVVKEYWSKGGY